MATRKSTPPNSGDTVNIPGVDPPPGVEANVRTTVSYKRFVDPDDVPEDDEISRLAAEQIEQMPLDPLTAFIEEWKNYVGYSVAILRFPDSAEKRMPGRQYVRPYFGHQPENIGMVTFDPNPAILIPAIQAENGDSGGVFQLWLIDQFGRRIPEAIAYGVAIADPPAHRRGQWQQQQTPQAPPETRYLPTPAPPPKSEAEMHLEKLKNDLFERMLNKALEERPPVVQTQLAPDDAAMLHILKSTNALPDIMSRLSELTKAAEAPAPSSWRDRMGEAAVALATQNPAILERVSGVIERIVARFLPDPHAPQYLPPPQPVQQAQPKPQQIAPPPRPQRIPPKTVEVDDSDDTENGEDFDDEPLTGDDAEMEVIERIIELMNSDTPLSLDVPVFAELEQEYPKEFGQVITVLAQMSTDTVILYVSGKSELYKSLLTGPASGPYLRRRLEELQGICKDAFEKAQQSQQIAPA